ncbi:ABC transporter permease [Cellulomonas sp. Sa3CUA2]|uniref:Transport permease protein n=1 Tax=Cellulomonas avistercoris TaxID=2762242 RepID=A0ABR8QGV9_9CELL|nr:ABC transporter permease [Cellulomonas avistercoris]MBD7919669.1 ABC transporter permease [Cellulomonas avistercoris]
MTATTLDTGTAAPPTRERRRSWWTDVWLVLARELRPVVREPFSLVFGLVQPLVFLALFGPLLVGSVGAGLPAPDVWLWFVPSVLVMTTLFGTSTTGSNLQDEMIAGSHERMLVSPLSRSSQIVGRALKEVVPLVAQALLVVLVMLPFGLRPDPVGVALGLALLAVLGVGLGAFSYALALAVRSQQWVFWAVQQTFLFPLMILSGLLLPLETGPRWMQVASSVNPLRWVVDAERALFAGDLAASAVAWGFLAAGLTAVAGLVVGVRAILASTD